MKLVNRLYEYRDLFYIYIWREFTVRYKNSIIGILWAIIQPLLLMCLFTFIFTFILDVNFGDYPKVVFFYAALLPWTFFSSSLNYSVFSLVNNYDLITKIYFPREILPLSGITVALIDFLIASLLYVVLLIVFKIHINSNALWVIPLMLLLIVFTVSISFLFSCVNVYYRDVGLLTRFIIQILFFASPIIYSIDKISMKIKIILFLNPLTFIIENMRRCVLEGRGVVLWQFLLVSCIVIVFYHYCYKLFIRIERNFADVI